MKDGTLCLCCPYAAVEIRHLFEKFSNWAIGSGPRGRRFKSSRPDQFFKNRSEICKIQSGSSLGFDVQIAPREPSAPYFKPLAFPGIELTFSHERWFSGSNPYAHLMLIGGIGAVTIDLAPHEAVEVVGEISARGIGRLVARNSARLRHQWARLHGKD